MMAVPFNAENLHGALLRCLEGSLSAESSVRKRAEDELLAASHQDGYGVALTHCVVDNAIPPYLRQLAAVVLKQYVKRHWHEGEEGLDDEEVVRASVPAADKLAIKKLLPMALGDQHAKIRVAVGMAVAVMASVDWPEEWPELMPQILEMLGDHARPARVHGALRCLALFSDSLADTQMQALLPLLLPQLHAIAAASPQVYDRAMLRRALSILHTCIAMLGLMQGGAQSAARELAPPIVQAWLPLVVGIIEGRLLADSPEDWGAKREALKVAQQLLVCFPKLVAPQVPALLHALWQLLEAGTALQERRVLGAWGGGAAEAADSDGEGQGLEALMVQLWELLLAVATHPRWGQALLGSLPELLLRAVAGMRITDEQVEVWSTDMAQFLAEEEQEAFTCRAQGVSLLQELVAEHGVRAGRAVADAAGKALAEASAQRARGVASWWKWREAALLALGCVSEAMLQLWAAGPDRGALLESIVAEDLALQPGSAAEARDWAFLQGRALGVAARFCGPEVPPPALRAALLSAAVASLQPAGSGVLLPGACAVLKAVSPHVDAATRAPLLHAALAGLAARLPHADEDTLALLLDALEEAVRADSGVALQFEASAHLGQAALQAWSRHVGDPVVSASAQSLLSALLLTPGCAPLLLPWLLPALGAVLANAAAQPEGLVEGALDLLVAVAKHTPDGALEDVVRGALPGALALVLSSEDVGVAQTGTELLAVLLSRCGRQLLLWGPGTPPEKLAALVHCASRLLSPSLEPGASLFVGRLLTALLHALQAELQPLLPGLLAALAAKLAATTQPELAAALVLVFAHMVRLSAPQHLGSLLDSLAAAPVPSGEASALAAVMRAWARHHDDIYRRSQVALATAALALLLATRDARLWVVRVDGAPLQAAGIVTRARARAQAPQYTQIPLPARMLALLGRSLARWEVADEGEDWEAVDDEDGEDAEDQRGDNEDGRLLPEVDVEEDDGTDEGEEQEEGTRELLEAGALSAFVAHVLRGAFASDPQAWAELATELSAGEKAALETALGPGSA